MQLIPDVRFTLQIMVATAPQKSSAKARILQASILLFARMPFSETSLRDIAAEAKVDVAYVHRAFGSKSEIFRQALEATAALDEVFTPDGNPAGLIDRITERAFLRDPQCIRDVEPLHLVLQSSSCSVTIRRRPQFMRLWRLCLASSSKEGVLASVKGLCPAAVQGHLPARPEGQYRSSWR